MGHYKVFRWLFPVRSKSLRHKAALKSRYSQMLLKELYFRKICPLHKAKVYRYLKDNTHHQYKALGIL